VLQQAVTPPLLLGGSHTLALTLALALTLSLTLT